MQLAGRGNLHLHLVRLVKDLLEVLALGEPDDDAMEKIESPKHVALANADGTGGPLVALFRRDTTKQPTAMASEADEEEDDDDEKGFFIDLFRRNTTKQPTAMANEADEEDDDDDEKGLFINFFRRDTTKQPTVMASEADEEDDDDDEKGLFIDLFRRDTTKQPTVMANEADEEDDEEKSVFDPMWELILGKDEMILNNEPIEEEDPIGSQLDHHRRIRLRFWEGDDDDDDDDDDSTSDDEDSFEDEDSASGVGFKLDQDCIDVGSDSDSESLSLEGTDASSISQEDMKSTEETDEIEGPTTLLKHPLDTGTTDHEQEDSAIDDSVEVPYRGKRSTLRSRVFILVKPKKDTKEQEENTPLVEESRPAKPKRASRASRLFLVKRPQKDTNKEHEQEAGIIASEVVPSDEQQSEPESASLSSRHFTKAKEDTKEHEQEAGVIASEVVPSDEQQSEPERASLSSRLFTKAKEDTKEHEQEAGDIASEVVPSDEQQSEPERASRSSRLVILAKPKKDTKEYEQEAGVIAAEAVPSDEQQSEPEGASLFSRLFTKAKEDTKEHEQEDSVVFSEDLPTWVQFESFPSPFLILAKPNKDANELEQEAGLIDSEDVPFDEQAELNWASPFWDTGVHELDEASPIVSAGVPSDEPAESTWESFSSQLMIPFKPKKDVDEDEQEASPVYSDEVPSNTKESESAGFKRSVISFRQSSLFKPKKDNKDHKEEESVIESGYIPDEENERVRRKRTMVLSRMLPFRRQEKSPPPLLETPVQAEHEIIQENHVSLSTNCFDCHLNSDDGGTEPGSSTGTDFGNWMSSSLGETDNNIEWELNENVGEEEVPDCITLKNKLSSPPKLDLMKSKMWPSLPKVVVDRDEDNIDKNDEMVKSEKDHKMALLRKRWANISKGMHNTYKKKKLSVGVEILDASGKVIRKVWLHSRRKKSTIEVSDSGGASDSDDYDSDDYDSDDSFISRAEI